MALFRFGLRRGVAWQQIPQVLQMNPPLRGKLLNWGFKVNVFGMARYFVCVLKVGFVGWFVPFLLLLFP
jgi:hypothetical protein